MSLKKQSIKKIDFIIKKIKTVHIMYLFDIFIILSGRKGDRNIFDEM